MATDTIAMEKVALAATPTDDALPRRLADFGTLGQALDYAARGGKGLTSMTPAAR